MKQIQKLLIANRGEIACRIIKTCQKLGVATVAVYSEADAHSLFVEMADEAVHIGPASPRESYLDMTKIIAAAKTAGADAIHPGYGFLSENDAFAELCAKEGIVFVGPPAAAIRAMGGKSEAKALMEKARVPLVPGYHGDNQDTDFLAAAADKIGYPVLIKASAGGGGKGMRVVEDAASFVEALSAAKREAKSAFANDHVLIEKYLGNPRHVEIQIFADAHGNTVYLFERDCSIQRRHQKVLEEAPSPALSPATREKMGAAAVSAAKAIGYVGAGTVEFLLDEKENFYFMEMNTRLQVEHPVTELITGLDLVALQLAVAEGQKLSFTQKDLFINGHAIEARLYAEDPANNFLPAAGQIDYLRFPLESDTVRIDTGVREQLFAGTDDGDIISIHYDPMIAKIIVWGETRDQAIAALQDALDETMVAGPKTNLLFLRKLAAHPSFVTGRINTHFIARHDSELMPVAEKPDEVTLALAVTGLLRDRLMAASYAPYDPYSPWNAPTGFRIGGVTPEQFSFDGAGDVFVLPGKDVYHPVIMAAGRKMNVAFEPSAYDCGYTARINGRDYHAVLLRDGRRLTVMRNGRQDMLHYLDPLAYEEEDTTGAGRLTAPMPGKVVAVRVQLGDTVTKGQPLVIVEAMKMEHTITAPADGVVKAINANVGDQVDEKLELIAFK